MGGTISRMELLTYGESFCLFFSFPYYYLAFSFQPSSCLSPIARLRLDIIHSTRASLVQLLFCLLSKQTKLAGKPYKFSLFTCSVLSFSHAFVKIFILCFYDPARPLLERHILTILRPKDLISSPFICFALLHTNPSTPSIPRSLP